MLIKITLIVTIYLQFIITKASVIPFRSNTRVGNIFGWFTVDNNNGEILKPIVRAERRWKGELSLSLGWKPLIASVELGYIRLHQKPSNIFGYIESGNGDFSEESVLTTQSNDVPDSSFESTTEISILTKTLNLTDFTESSFDSSVDRNRVRRDAPENKESANQEYKTEIEDDMESTSIEPTIIPMSQQEKESSENVFVTLSPPTDSDAFENVNKASSYDKFPYPTSNIPFAQHVAITHTPRHQYYVPPVKSYYDFNPSQIDYSYIPHCINSLHHKFVPIIHDAWMNYPK
ncbi:CLUMA_CG015876, isoform A, partial [Clunio marinus]